MPSSDYELAGGVGGPGSELSIAPARRDAAAGVRTQAIRADQRDHTKPFNIASYALLTHMLAQQCGLEVGEFVWTGGDCHLYLNHLEQARLQLGREPGTLPKLEIVRKPGTIDGYALEDFVLHGYEAQAHIKAEVAV